MSTPITYPRLQQNQPYCQIQDVLYLIGQAAPIVNGTCTNDQIQSAIDGATEYIEQRCQRFFSAKRVIGQIDGNEKSRIVLPYQPIININSIDVYFTVPLQITRRANDYDLLMNRNAGVISFPAFVQISPLFSPFAFTFFKASHNVTYDYWVGYTRKQFGEVMQTTDNTTYTFYHPTVIKQSQLTTGDSTVPPQFFPIIYKNGVAINNTTYVLTQQIQPFIDNVWNVQQDNLVFQFNEGLNGYTSITFNTPNSPSDVITADYSYYYIKEDIVEATAKKAAVTLLQSFATTQGYTRQQFQGASSIQDDGSRIQYQNGGPFGEQISNFQSEVESIIKINKKAVMPIGGSFNLF